MLSVRLNHDGQQGGSEASVQIVDSQRAQVILPTDAVLMVTTTAVSRWDVATARAGVTDTTPGAEFAGIVVEVGEGVATVNLDDLVVARCVVPTGQGGASVRFGSDALDGGHAEYVRVPHADETLVKTTAASEERSVFAGGSAALGIAAAEAVISSAGEGRPFRSCMAQAQARQGERGFRRGFSRCKAGSGKGIRRITGRR